MKIVDFESYKKAVSKLDALASEQTAPLVVFPQKTEKSAADRLKQFFEIADGNGNPEWNA